MEPAAETGEVLDERHDAGAQGEHVKSKGRQFALLSQNIVLPDRDLDVILTQF